MKIKEKDFFKDPQPGRWVKDKDGFLVKEENSSRHPGKVQDQTASDSGQAGMTDKNKKSSADDSKADS